VKEAVLILDLGVYDASLKIPENVFQKAVLEYRKVELSVVIN